MRGSWLLTCLVFALACTDGRGTPMNMQPDAVQPTVDASRSMWPRWMLEDVQPQSPRAGQTYGLDTFASKIVVVVLLEGF